MIRFGHSVPGQSGKPALILVLGAMFLSLFSDQSLAVSQPDRFTNSYKPPIIRYFAGGWCPRGLLELNGRRINPTEDMRYSHSSSPDRPVLIYQYYGVPAGQFEVFIRLYYSYTKYREPIVLPDYSKKPEALGGKVAVCAEPNPYAPIGQRFIGEIVRNDCGGDTIPADGQMKEFRNQSEMSHALYSIIGSKFGREDYHTGKVTAPNIPGACIINKGTFPRRP